MTLKIIFSSRVIKTLTELFAIVSEIIQHKAFSFQHVNEF